MPTWSGSQWTSRATLWSSRDGSRKGCVWWTKSWWRYRGRAVADRHRHRLLQHDRVLSDVYELRHAREWTAALTRWCESQPEMVAHNGLCLVHRAEIMQLQGAWGDALDEARRAAERFTQGVLNQLALRAALLPTGRGPSSSGRARRGGGGLPGGEPARVASRNRASPSSGLRRATAMPQPQRSAAR